MYVILKKVEGHENMAIAAAAAAAQASAPDAPDGAAAAGEGDLEGTTGDPEGDDILKASKSVNNLRPEILKSTSIFLKNLNIVSP